MPRREILRMAPDCSVMDEFVDAAIYAIETGELTHEEAFSTLLEFVIWRGEVVPAE